jgi:hypothetical protein
VEATLATGSVPRTGRGHFHLWMAGVFLLIAFGGFTPTYWAPVATGRFHAPPIVHIHGMLLFAWTLLYFLQTALVSSGRTPAHRAWGLAGISLFSVLICSIIATQITMLRLEEARSFGEAARRFSAIVFVSLPLMIGLFAAAIANVRRPEIHKRLMLVLMASMMTPAVARLFITFLAPPGVAAGGPPPPFVAVPPGLVSSLLIIVAMIYDWRTRGRPHPVYVYGFVLVVANILIIVPVSATQTWMNIAFSLQRVLG